MSASTQQMILATVGAIMSVAYVAIIVWWVEQRWKENDRHRERLAERDLRDVGCHAWSAYMAAHMDTVARRERRAA